MFRRKRFCSISRIVLPTYLLLCAGLDPRVATAGSAGLDRSTFDDRDALGIELDLLLIPDCTEDRVMAFDPATGDLVDANFIPPDPNHLAQPIQAILSAAGDTILVSDRDMDVVQEYDFNGNYLGVFAPVGGPDPAIMESNRGLTLRANGNLLVAVGAGANADAIAEFDTAGNYLGNFVEKGSGGLDGPRSVVVYESLLVTGDASDTVQEFDLETGEYLGDLMTVDSFPSQLALAANESLLIAVLDGLDDDVVELRPDGSFRSYEPLGIEGSVRGVYELRNGNLLVAGRGGVHEITRMNDLKEAKLLKVDARFIERVTVPPIRFTLSFVGTCPGRTTIAIRGGTPGGRAFVLRGTGAGSEILPAGPCVGTPVDLEGVSVAVAVDLNASGNASFFGNPPPSGCGQPFQVLDAVTCETSNVMRLASP